MQSVGARAKTTGSRRARCSGGRALKQSGVQVYRDPELLGKDVPEPRLDTEPAKWSKNK